MGVTFYPCIGAIHVTYVDNHVTPMTPDTSVTYQLSTGLDFERIEASASLIFGSLMLSRAFTAS